MQTSLPKKTIGCIGKCTSGLSPEELDKITDNICKTLISPNGRRIFKIYLQQGGFIDNLECLELYETCVEFIEKDKHYLYTAKNPDINSLRNDLNTVKELVEDLDGVNQIDKAFMERFNKALMSDSRCDMVEMLKDARDCMCNHLRHAHKHFKLYASEPCPLTK